MGAVLSREPLLSLIALMSFHNAILSTLEAEEENKRQGMDEALEAIGPDGDRTMAVLSIDLDGFKLINDTHGHGAGDLTLIEAARRLRANLRATDLLGRMGGDEFIVVLFDITPEAVPPVAAALIDGVSNRPVTVSPDTEVRIGASVGYACLPQDAGTTVALRLMADRALYKAKDAGKGRALRFTPPEHVKVRRA